MTHVKNPRVYDTPYWELSVTPFDISVEVAAAQVALGTAGYYIPLCKFPPNAQIVLDDRWEFIVDDLDTDGTPSLTLDLVAADDQDGTNADVLINNSTVGQAGGTDALDGNEEWTDIGDKFLLAKVEANAATAAAGTIRVRGWYVGGLSAVTIDLQSESTV